MKKILIVSLLLASSLSDAVTKISRAHKRDNCWAESHANNRSTKHSESSYVLSDPEMVKALTRRRLRSEARQEEEESRLRRYIQQRDKERSNRFKTTVDLSLSALGGYASYEAIKYGSGKMTTATSVEDLIKGLGACAFGYGFALASIESAGKSSRRNFELKK